MSRTYLVALESEDSALRVLERVSGTEGTCARNGLSEECVHDGYSQYG